MPSVSKRQALNLPVYRAEQFTVVNGANLGDPLSFADELDLDDIYELSPVAREENLRLVMEGPGDFSIGEGSGLGQPGATVHLDSALMLMSENGHLSEMLVLVEVDAQGLVGALYGMPLQRLSAHVGYTLVGVDRENAVRKFAQAACVSFTRGTLITMGSGEQRAVEDLCPGDMVLTRDDGVQPLRWAGQSTVRAEGEFAPVRIRAGTLHNENDLVVSPDHRLFIYQRSDALGAGRHEVLVRARHLVNGDSVLRDTGGFVDYFQLLFDSHQIIYAEGIAAETLLVDQRTHKALPPDLQEELMPDPEKHNARDHLRYEVSKTLLDIPDAAERLKHASTR